MSGLLSTLRGKELKLLRHLLDIHRAPVLNSCFSFSSLTPPHHSTPSTQRHTTCSPPKPLCDECLLSPQFTSFVRRFRPNSTLAPSRGFKTRTTSGIGGKRATESESDKEPMIWGSATRPPVGASADGRADEGDTERHEIESALRKRRKSISRILNKYRNAPEVQQQIKIAFADGYAYAEEKNTRPETNESYAKTGPMSSIYKMAEVIWFIIKVAVAAYLLYYIFHELSHAFGGDGIGGLSGQGLFNSLGPYEVNPEDIFVTFADVKGVDEAKEELQDVVEFLKDPERFSTLGGKMPHGVLLVGEPGVGKTLLAKAVAGEAGVPFFHAAGSEFDEIFVGTGAKRIRQLFASAKERAPAVIFIDEIDSVGGKRTSSPGHPYANQTINMLLSEMDGFNKNEGVIVVGATNKRDNLDKALIRPGRFDVEVLVYPPDQKARKDLFDLYITKIKADPEVDAVKLARDTRGFVGADIDNMVNQAAIKAGQENASAVGMTHLDWARDKVSMGPEKKCRIPDPKVNWNTAVHEGGHAVVAFFTKDALPIRKVTIMPRGPALGYVEQTPKDVMINQSKSELLASMDVAMGGKLGEELEQDTDDVTPGCSSDLEKATSIATAMVTLYGMSDAVGKRVLASEEDYQEISNSLKTTIDEEIKALVEASYERARNILTTYKKEHVELAKALIKYETLDLEDVAAVLENRPLTKNEVLPSDADVSEELKKLAGQVSGLPNLAV